MPKTRDIRENMHTYAHTEFLYCAVLVGVENYIARTDNDTVVCARVKTKNGDAGTHARSSQVSDLARQC